MFTGGFRFISVNVDKKLQFLGVSETVESGPSSFILNVFALKRFKLLFLSLYLPPKPKLSFQHLKLGIQQFNFNLVLAPADKIDHNYYIYHFI